MTLSISQLEQLISIYAEHIVDGMDLKTLEQFAYDCIVERMENLLENEVIDEIKSYYDDEDLSQMIESVGADPDTIL